MGLRKRRETAFESLYSRHVREVYGYALAMLGSAADAEDVTQTTFLNAYRAIERGEHPHTPRSWLLTIARNVCRQRFRQAARRPREVELDDALAFQEESDGPSAEDITRALQSLPLTQRSALVMRELEGRSQAEIADALDVSVSAVETLLFRARRGMREQLETALTCGEAARAISRQLDGGSSRAERAALRAHLRACEECSTFARRARAHRGALRRLRALPLPASLLSWSFASAGGSAIVASPAGGLGLKLLAGAAATAIAAGATERVVARHDPPPRAAKAAAATPAASVAPIPVRRRTAPPSGGESEPREGAGHARVGATRHSRGAKRVAGGGHARGHAKAGNRETRPASTKVVTHGATKRAAPAASVRPPAREQHAAVPKPAHSSKPPRSAQRPAPTPQRVRKGRKQ